MAADSSAGEARRIVREDDLLEPFVLACKPRERFRIGAEAEKFGLLEGSLRPIGYDAPEGVEGVMRDLVAHHGDAAANDRPLLMLTKEGASVTLEPGAQLELSGAPLATLHAIDDEVRDHMRELEEVSARRRARGGEGVLWFGVGYHPLAAQAELPWVPKPRYGVMREYLPTRGQRGLDMMRRTATVQANFDYESEEHAMRCLRLGSRLAPLTSALFANSPFVEGRPFGGVSQRTQVWLDVDPSRQGLLPRLWSVDTGFADYVAWALDAPMFLLLRPEGIVPNTGQTFREFLAHGFGEHRATMDDWVTHINSMFPEVRLKRTLEVRGGDSLPAPLVAAPAALFTGLFYDELALGQAEELVAGLGYEELEALRPAVAKDGLRAELRGRPLAVLAEQIVELARAALVRRGITRADGRDESVHLESLVRLAASARCPADDLLEAYRAHPEPGPAAVLAALRAHVLVAG